MRDEWSYSDDRGRVATAVVGRLEVPALSSPSPLDDVMSTRKDNEGITYSTVGRKSPFLRIETRFSSRYWEAPNRATQDEILEVINELIDHNKLYV